MRFITLTTEGGRTFVLNAAAFESVRQASDDDLDDGDNYREVRTRGGDYMYVRETIEEVISLVTRATQRN